MDVLVVGGAGYIGSTVASQLRAAGHGVVVLDDLSRGHRAAVPDGAALEVGDFGDAATLDRLFAACRFDAVMHFAALIEVGESMRAPEQFFHNNAMNTLTLARTMLRHGVRRLVFSSTAALFGMPERIPIAEDDRIAPTSHGLRFACLRYFNAAGARDPDQGEDHRPESHLIPLVLQVALGQRDSVMMFGTDYDTPDGTCVRDYIHVADLARAHLLALAALEQRPALHFNLGNGTGYSVRQVIAAARDVTGHAIPAVAAPRRPGDPAALVASAARIRTELGWQPQVPKLHDIIASAWEWHRRHPHGYADRATGRDP
jgi:UDP-glucose 4-epimerase